MRSRADPPATDLEESLTISPGDVVGGRFRVERLVGEGGMGSVFLARDTQEDIAVALKVLAPLVDGRSADADAAVREAQLLSDLRHPGIVGLVAHGVTERGRRYIAMEWIDGHDLDHHLKDQRLDLAETLRLGRRVAEALAAAHRIGVIHRDIKPGNIILPGGRPEAAKLVDFGIAQITRSTILTAGTLGFAAPEQLTPGADVDARVDVFALGWVLIACLVHGAGARLDEEDTQVTAETRDDGPEDGDESEGPPDIVALCPEAPPQLQALLHRMISRAPEERPANAGVVASEIQAIAAALEDSDAVITAREQHLVAAIALPHLKALGVDEPTVRGLLQRYGAALEPGAAACDLVRIHALVAEGDLATRVARCALELRRVLPLAPLSLVLRLVSDDLAALREEAICLFTQASTGSPRGVLVNAEAAGLLGTRFELEAEADATTLLREATATRGARMLLGRPSPWVGRADALARFEASYRRSRDVPVALLISGETGMGKSRLTHEGIAALERSGHAPEVWSARADPVAVGSPLSLITQLLQSAAGIADGEPLALRQGRLRRYLARRVSRSRLDRLTTFLAELIRAPFPDDHSDALRVARQDPAIMSQQTRSAWTETIAAVSAFRPVILWIDDLQWGDLASVRFLDHVLDPAVGARVLLIAAGRPELFSRFPQLWTTRVIERVALTGLSLAEQRQFVRAALGDAAPPEPTLDALITRTEGNPLFLEELARAFAKGSFDQLPQTMVAIIQARLQALDFEARQLLRGASVFGKSFWVEGVAALRGEDEAPAGLREWIDELVAQELLVPVPGSRYPATSEFEFHNATVRDAAYRTLPDADARAAHCAVARWLTAVGETNAAVIAEHFLRGEAYAEATAWYATAADQAFERNEFDAVRELVRRGIEHAPPGEARGRLLLRRAEVLAVAGNHAEAAEAALAAVDELPKNSPRWYSATGEAAQACARIGDQARVRDIIAMLSDIEPAATGGVNFVGLVTAALPLASAGKIKTARELLARVIAVTSAMAEVDPSALGPMHSARALGAVAGGMLGSAFVNLEAAAIAFEEAGSVRYALEHFGGAGFFCLELGQLDRGEQILRRTIRRSAEVGLEHLGAVARHNLGRRLGEAGRLEEGLALEREALASFERHGNGRMQGLTHCHIAWILLHGGRLDDAASHVERALTFLEGQPASRVIALATRARIELARGHVEAALADAGAAREGLAALDRVQEGESLVLLTWAEALDAAGRTDEAHEAIVAARRSVGDRSQNIEQPELRASFRHAVPENARILALARAWERAAT